MALSIADFIRSKLEMIPACGFGAFLQNIENGPIFANDGVPVGHIYQCNMTKTVCFTLYIFTVAFHKFSGHTVIDHLPLVFGSALENSLLLGGPTNGPMDPFFNCEGPNRPPFSNF